MDIFRDEVFGLSVRIHAVSAGSPADKAGIGPDDRIVSINGENVDDEIDYQALSAAENLSIEYQHHDNTYTVCIRKQECLWISFPGGCARLCMSKTTTGG